MDKKQKKFRLAAEYFLTVSRFAEKISAFAAEYFQTVRVWIEGVPVVSQLLWFQLSSFKKLLSFDEHEHFSEQI